jgi:cold shock CspA family protein
LRQGFDDVSADAPISKEGTSMANGTISSLRDRGFGFIARDGQEGDGQVLFFNSSTVTDDDFDRLREGLQVSYDEEPDPRDPTRRWAVNVLPVGSIST